MSTIITDNPYTFTVADNMNIKAVFENAQITITNGGTTSVVLSNKSDQTYTWNITSNPAIYTGSVSGFELDNLKYIYKFSSSQSGTRDTYIKTIDISGSSITQIPQYAFQGCTNLTSVIFPNSLVQINDYSFQNCAKLASITFSNILKNINAYAFQGCTGLTNITLPDSLTTIGGSAFRSCTGLTSITFPKSIYEISSYAFQDCTNLATFTIPNSVNAIFKNTIGNTAWWNNQSNEIVYKDNVCFGYKSTKPTGALTINSGTRLIADNAIYQCPGLTSITLPDSLRIIRSYAFSSCTGLTSITLPDSLTTINRYAFSGCTNLATFTIPSSINKIYRLTFNDTAWWNNHQSNEIVYKDNVCFGYKSTKPTGDITINSGTRVIAAEAFSSCTGLTSITLPDSLTTISYSAFNSCSNLETLTFPSSVKIIYRDAIVGTKWWNNQPSSPTVYIDNICLGYKGTTPTGDITINSGTRVIAGTSFESMRSITSITFPNTLESIGYSAFNSCTGLTSITLPASLTTLDERVFNGCVNLTSITCLATVPPVGVDGSTFANNDCPIYVPAASVNTYKAAAGWSDYSSRIQAIP